MKGGVAQGGTSSRKIFVEGIQDRELRRKTGNPQQFGGCGKEKNKYRRMGKGFKPNIKVIEPLTVVENIYHILSIEFFLLAGKKGGHALLRGRQKYGGNSKSAIL